MRGQSIELAFAIHGFFVHHGHAGAVHLHIQDRDGFAHDDRQVELHRAVNLVLLPSRNIGADGFRHTLDGLSGDLQAG